MRNARLKAKSSRCKAITLNGNPCPFNVHGLGMSTGEIVYLPTCHLHGSKRYRDGRLADPGKYNLSPADERLIVKLMGEWIEDFQQVRAKVKPADSSKPTRIGGYTFSEFHRIASAITRVLPYEESYQFPTEEELELKFLICSALRDALETANPTRQDLHAMTRRAIRDGKALAFDPNRFASTHDRGDL